MRNFNDSLVDKIEQTVRQSAIKSASNETSQIDDDDDECCLLAYNDQADYHHSQGKKQKNVWPIHFFNSANDHINGFCSLLTVSSNDHAQLSIAVTYHCYLKEGQKNTQAAFTIQNLKHYSICKCFYV